MKAYVPDRVLLSHRRYKWTTDTAMALHEEVTTFQFLNNLIELSMRSRTIEDVVHTFI